MKITIEIFDKLVDYVSIRSEEFDYRSTKNRYGLQCGFTEDEDPERYKEFLKHLDAISNEVRKLKEKRLI